MLRFPAASLHGICLALVLSSGVVAPAHAGLFEWVDGMFTFREDQKERVAPRRTLPPIMVYSPSYDEQTHQGWSGYYTRQDLVPQTYIAGSGSKVMRPEGGGTYGSGGGYGTGGVQRGGPSDRVFVGEPGQGPGMRMGDSNVGGATRIGAANQDWRDENYQGADPMGSRAGDYNHRLHPAERDVYGSPRGGIAANATRQATIANGDYAGDDGNGRYVDFNDQGQVTKYKVQSGDTLSGIAEQPRIYDNWKLWPLIYSANRKSIGGNPANLKVEQRLDVPRDYTDAQARDAERRAGRR